MSLTEVGWRISTRAGNEIWKLTKQGRVVEIPERPSADAEIQPIFPPQSDVCGDDPAGCISAADDVLAGKFCVFGVPVELQDGVPIWNRDPLSGIRSPMKFGPTLNYRNENTVGDIKFLWEPNRHLQFVTLAQAARITEHQKYSDGLKRFFISWFDQCPYLAGPNWTSSLELAIRLINWSFTWRILESGRMAPFSGRENESLKRRLLESVHQHCFFISRHYSRFSSANNHLIGEAAGVFVAACTWPNLPNMGAWKAQALEILTQEIDRQTTKDGFNAELTTAYHEFVMEFALAGLLTAEASGLKVPTTYRESVQRMTSCANLVRDVAGNVPMFGDADDGHVFRLSYEESFDSLRSTSHACSAVLDLQNVDGTRIDAQSLWLLNYGQADRLRSSRANDACESDVALSDTGYFLLGHNLNTPEEIRLWVDVGKLGFLSIAAHGHADALSIYLAAAGEEILIDPGTYAYHTDKSWRDYFKGTSAHNTVCVDKIDQSVNCGNFMWTDHAVAEVDSLVLGDVKSSISAHHDGYARLEDPVIHRRNVSFDKENGLIEIEDMLDCSGPHAIDIHWHFAENLTLQIAKDLRSWTAVGVNVCADFNVETDHGDVELTIANGENNPPAGWVSRSFASKQSASTVRCTQNIMGQTRFLTKISIRKTSRAQLDGFQ